ncbi:uncharacterized protein EMH_0099600 [Eimeria mitis]|uniref:Uncharacterized protein n=1 Tax=Eimeria mitis TaxID=44415 RepID=U6JNK0_9EIME|nr:uncharacterized protein EMH_0099600 [Eimeria mitis]CDJ27084.1 hypothetical protein, conserved [Eimeria mitis]
MSFACRRGRVQTPQKVGSAVATAVAIALRVVEAVGLQGRSIGTHEGVGEVERVLDVRLGAWFSPRERGRVQTPQKVGSAVAIAVAIALRVVEVVERQGRGCADVIVYRRHRKWVRLW